MEDVCDCISFASYRIETCGGQYSSREMVFVAVCDSSVVNIAETVTPFQNGVGKQFLHDILGFYQNKKNLFCGNGTFRSIAVSNA